MSMPLTSLWAVPLIGAAVCAFLGSRAKYAAMIFSMIFVGLVAGIGYMQSSFAALAVAPGFVLIAGGSVVNGLSSGPVGANQGAELLDLGCVATNCAQRQYTCGATTDGCGVPLDCGSCSSGVCSKNQCVACVAATCASLGATCGTPSDGCGGTLSCGTCGSAQTCSLSNRCETTPGPDSMAAWDPSIQMPQCVSAGRSCDTGALVVSRATLGAWEPSFPNTLSSSCADGTSGLFHVAPSLDRVVVRSASGWLGDGPIQLEATVWVSSLSERLDVFVRPINGSTWNWAATVAPTAFGQQVLTTSFTLPSQIPTFVRTQYRASASAVSCATGAFDDRDDLLFQVQVPDVTPPFVSFSTPAMGATVRGAVTVSGSASNETARTTGVFDGQTLLFTSSASFWSGTWNTLNAAQGTHHLYARSTDATGNVRTTLNLLVVVDNSPVVSLSAPSQGANVSGTVSLSAAASAVTGRTVQSLEFFVDGASVGVGNAEPWQVTWNSRLVDNGAHLVTARATDSSALTTTSSAVNVTVSNDVTAPVVSILAPAANAVLRGEAVVDANVSDESAITSVAVFDGASLVASGTSAPWTFAWDTSGAAQGGHSLRVVATDEFGNVGEATVTLLVDNAPVVVVTSPSEAQMVSQGVSLEATVGLGGTHTLYSLTWIIDGEELTTLGAPPWSLTWDSRTRSNGTHVLVARAVDSVGLIGQSAPVSVETSNDFAAPVVVLTAPAAAAVVRASVQIEGTLSDASALAATRVAIDGVTLASGVTSPFSVAWNTASVSDGAHMVRLEGTDVFSQFASVERTVMVDNTLPAVALTAPVAGLVGGNVVLSASASDVSGVVQVQFFANGALVGTDASAPYSVTWNATALSGAQALTAVATDAAGNVRTSAAVNVTVAGAQPATYSSTFRAPRCATASTSCVTGASLVNGRGTVGPETNRPNTLSASCNDGNSGTFHGSGESIDRLEVLSVSGGPIVPGATVRVRATVWATQSTNRVDFYSAANANSPSWTLRATATPSSLNGVTTVETTFVLPAGGTQAVRAAMRRGGSAATCPSGNFNDRDDLVFATN